ncbi:MAG: hypothetical protein JWQ32_2723 [Marmoricola sp.]|nr:hypothetical protein [Marmoricola sp.]
MTTAETEFAGWGGAPTMNALETIIWRAESDGGLRSTMMALEILDRAPAWEDFVDAHRRAASRIPRLRQHVVESPLGLAAPRWQAQDGFDLNHHLHRSRLPEQALWQDLFTAVEKSVASPFDRSRPPWEATLYEGLPGGRAAYALKLHHSSTDGVGTLQLMQALHSERSEAAADGAVTARAAHPSVGWAAIAEDALSVTRSAPSAARHVLTALHRVVDDPMGSTVSSLRYGLSLQRVLAPPAAKPSRLLAGRSTTWRLAALDVDLASLRASAKAAGGSLNDAYLAALLGGYRLYHEAHGEPGAPIPIAIPISVRQPHDPAGGNRFASARLSGPAHLIDPAERIGAIRAMVHAARLEPALDNLAILAPLIARLPAPALAQVAGGMARANDLQASNVPGFGDEVFFAGVRVDRLYPFAPLPGCPAMITLVSHGPTCCVGVNYDPAAFTDGDLFLSCLEAGFNEVLELGGAHPVQAGWLR